jgi:hypothetical protein
MIAKKDPVTGMSQLTVEEDEDDEGEKKEQLSPEEIRARQQRDREEKQKRYDEARAKIFGEPAPSSGTSSPGNVTPPRAFDGQTTQRSRGRGRGGRRNNNEGRDTDNRRPNAQAGTRELFDPSYTPKPGFSVQKRGGSEGGDSQSERSTVPAAQEQAIRAPRGPDGSGRGGFGFAKRGVKDS